MKKENSQRLMIHCEHARFLSSKSELQKLGFKEKIQLFIHQFICKSCRVFDKQQKKLCSLIRQSFTNKKSIEMDKNKKDAIEQKLHDLTSKL